MRHFFHAGIFEPEGRRLRPIISVSGWTAFIPCLIDFMVAWHFVCSGYPRQFFQPQLLDWSRNGSSKKWHSRPSNSSLGMLDKLSLFVVHSYSCGVFVSTVQAAVSLDRSLTAISGLLGSLLCAQFCVVNFGVCGCRVLRSWSWPRDSRCCSGESPSRIGRLFGVRAYWFSAAYRLPSEPLVPVSCLWCGMYRFFFCLFRSVGFGV